MIKKDERDGEGNQFNPENIVYDKGGVVITEWWGNYEVEINVYVKGKHIYKGGYKE